MKRQVTALDVVLQILDAEERERKRINDPLPYIRERLACDLEGLALLDDPLRQAETFRVRLEHLGNERRRIDAVVDRRTWADSEAMILYMIRRNAELLRRTVAADAAEKDPR